LRQISNLAVSLQNWFPVTVFLGDSLLVDLLLFHFLSTPNFVAHAFASRKI